MPKRAYSLYCDPLQFNGVTIDRPSKALVLSWVADTEVQNIAFIRIVALRLRIPPIRVAEGFIDLREFEEGETDEAQV
jgi:hypothetical protein